MRLLRFKDLQKIIPASRSSIFRWSKENHFPSSIKIGSRAVAWREEEINSWLSSKLGLTQPEPSKSAE